MTDRGRGARAPRTAAAVLAASLAALAGCPRVPPSNLARDPAALLDQLRAAQDRVKRVRGSARVKIASPQLSGTVNEFVAAEKPDSVHLSTLDFFGNPAVVLVASGGRFGLWDAQKNVYYRGDATPENVSRLLPVMLPVEELVTILCGSAPVLPGEPLEVGVQDALVLLTVGRGLVGQRLGIGEGAAVEWSRVRQRVVDAGGARDVAAGYDLAFGRFRRAGGVRFPGEEVLDAPAGRSRVELVWRDDLEVNGDATSAMFRVEPPRGARVVELPSGAPAPAIPFPVEESRE
jgi:hypothetical protein